jgi:hypothetical protein
MDTADSSGTELGDLDHRFSPRFFSTLSRRPIKRRTIRWPKSPRALILSV